MGQRNEALQRVAAVLVGDWTITMTNARFWENPAAVVDTTLYASGAGDSLPGASERAASSWGAPAPTTCRCRRAE